MILTQAQIHEMNILVDLVQHCHPDWTLRQMVDFVVSNLTNN
jgi:ribosomal protein L31